MQHGGQEEEEAEREEEEVGGSRTLINLQGLQEDGGRGRWALQREMKSNFTSENKIKTETKTLSPPSLLHSTRPAGLSAGRNQTPLVRNPPSHQCQRSAERRVKPAPSLKLKLT